ncbi:hypothetical protein [Effusibacillus consociatus]|uniref:Flagellin Flp1-like domain-containing protein n=1 Tax=Effusibacillus consociatus TaxID=1117041 RepID=A0ABV9PZG0_9BACL
MTKGKKWKQVWLWSKSFFQNRSGLEFWEYMVLAIVIGGVIWTVRPLLIDLFTTIIQGLKSWWSSRIGA